MNPTLSEKMISREKAKDLSAGQAEWHAEFREDIEAFISLESMGACLFDRQSQISSLGQGS